MSVILRRKAIAVAGEQQPNSRIFGTRMTGSQGTHWSKEWLALVQAGFCPVTGGSADTDQAMLPAAA